MAEAKAIVSGPPSGGDGAGGESNVGLDVVLADEESDRRALAGEARRAWRFTPLVSLPPSTASARSVVEDARSRPDTVLANITGCGHLFGGESGLALEMQSECLERGYRVRVSVADSPGTAWAIARAAEWADLPWTPLVASEGRDELWMSRLPIEALALQPGVVRSLRELDVVKVDRLLELPVEEIKRRFGDETLWRIDRALGRVQEPLECLPMPDPVMAGHIFEFPVSRSDWLQEGLRELVVEVAAGLQSRGRVAWRLVCRVRSEMASGGTSWTEWVTGLVEPSYEAEHLWELVQLQSQRRRWPLEVVELEVVAEGVVTPESSQKGLFDTGVEAESAMRNGRPGRGVARLVERLSSRLGDRAVSRPVLCDAVVPEAASVLVPMRGEVAGDADVETVTESGLEWRSRFGPAGRPLRLFESPRAIEVMAVVPEGPPVQFVWDGRNRLVVRYWGPERIETGWWTDREVSRDYYRVETGSGEWCWLFHRRCDARWFVHGVFE